MRTKLIPVPVSHLIAATALTVASNMIGIDPVAAQTRQAEPVRTDELTLRRLPARALDVLGTASMIIGDADGNGRFDSGDVLFAREVLRHPKRSSSSFLADVARPCNGQLEARDGKRLLGALQAKRIGMEIRSHCHGEVIGAAWQRPANRQPPPLVTLDDMFVRITRQAPGFGGLYLDAQRNLRVVLVDPSEARLNAAKQAIAEVFGADRFAGSAVVEVRGDFDFLQLKGWKDRAEPLLGVEGVVLVDADERKNRVRIGIDDESHRQEIEAHLGRLTIPPEAVQIDVVERPVFQNHVLVPDLQSKRRPLFAGLEINSPSSGCSLGFLAKWYGEARGFVTASHCTLNPGSPSLADPSPGEAFFQQTMPDQVGTEAIDPEWGCDWGPQCRMSDAIFVELDPGVTGKLGVAGRHLHEFPHTGRYKIVGKGTAVSGDIVHRIGRTSGEVSGELGATCCGFTLDGASVGWTGDFTVTCQNTYDTPGAGGDSGGPVLRVIDDPNDEAELLGIHVVAQSGASTESIYSPIWNIEHEIGTLEIAGNEAPEIVITSPEDGSKIGPGAFPTVQLEAQVFDFEGGADCVTCDVDWYSGKDGPLGITPWENGTSGQSVVLGGGQGYRAITATAKDAKGKTAWDTVVVSTGNSVPYVWIDAPAPGAVLYTGFPYVLQGSSFDNEEFQALNCKSLDWSVSPADPSFPASGCTAQVSFSTPGIHSVTLTGQDPDGASASTTHVVAVLDPPANAGPSLVFTAPANNSYVQPDQPVTIKAIGTDPDHQSPITYDWVLTSGAANGQAFLGTTTGASGTETSLTWTPGDDVVANCGASSVTLTLHATDPGGQIGQAKLDLGVLYPPC